MNISKNNIIPFSFSALFIVVCWYIYENHITNKVSTGPENYSPPAVSNEFDVNKKN